jgi:hypothetical protein
MATYPYTVHDDHFIVDGCRQRWLLDTGSPVSVGDGSIEFGELTHTPANNLMGITIGALQEMVGAHFNTLIGMDVLGRHGLLINRTEQWIEVGTDAEVVNGYAEPLTFTLGIPTLSARVGEHAVSLFFDTGAKITYLSGEFLPAGEPIREAEDFYPGLGTFTTPVYRINAEIGGQTGEIEVGKLPEALQVMVGGAGVQGILGNSAWVDRTLYLSASEATLVFDAVINSQEIHHV